MLFFLFPGIVLSQNFGGNPASVKWMQVNSNTARVIFPEGLDSQARRIAAIIRLLDSTTLHTIGSNIRSWNVVLQTANTEANAYVRLAPVISELYMLPPQNSFANGSIRWDDNLVIHENRHMQQFSNFNHGFTKAFSFLFGQEGQLLANGLTIPNYFFEGDAVFQETLVSRQGRGRMPSFFNGLKALWLADKRYGWMLLRNGSLRKYTPDHYELGYPVLLYGYEKYGSDFWRKVTSDAVDFKGVFYPYNKAVQRYSGKKYTQFTKDALQYFREQTVAASGKDNFNFITPEHKNNVTDYLFPQYVTDDTLVVTKQSYREVNSFYLIVKGKEEKIRVKDFVLDDYFSYNAGKIVYASYQSDPVRANRNYSVIKKLDIHTAEQIQLTSHSNYFSPDINADATEIVAVKVNPDGSSFLHRINAYNGTLLQEVPNTAHYFFTHPKYIDRTAVVTAVRNAAGQMALVKVDLMSGSIENLTEFSYAVLGYPTVKNGIVYFSKADGAVADRIFAVSLSDKKLYRISENNNSVYQPAVNSKGEMIATAFTAGGHRLIRISAAFNNDKPATPQPAELQPPPGSDLFTLSHTLDNIVPGKMEITKYPKSFQLLNFHSARPFADDPEYGYTFYSDNILHSFHSEASYTYNRNEQSHAAGYNIVYSGIFPFVRGGVERTFSRKVSDTAGNVYNYNSTKLNIGWYTPFRFINGRTFTFLTLGAGFNSEFLPDRLERKQVKTEPLNYWNAYMIFTNRSRMARQFINPHWQQSMSVTYRNAYTFSNNRKLVADASFSFPGLFASHSLVIDGAFQHRDTLPDYFSKTFSVARGYQDLNQRRMYKVGVNYHFPICYPDWGFGNIVFFQRVRINAFYDYGSSLTKFRDGSLREIKTRSTGAEIYFDTKFWNALPVNFGVRYSRLLDDDLLNRGAVNRWEFILPLNIIPD